MPDERDHRLQSAANEQFANEAIFHQNNKYIDWKITALFYAAIHLIEAKLAKRGFHTETHIERSKVMEKVSEFRGIRFQYQALRQFSQAARYDCVYDSATLQLAEKNYADIKNGI